MNLNYVSVYITCLCILRVRVYYVSDNELIKTSGMYRGSSSESPSLYSLLFFSFQNNSTSLSIGLSNVDPLAILKCTDLTKSCSSALVYSQLCP